MRVALITDTHFGARNDSDHFLRLMKEFYETQFFPTLKKEGITHIVHLGDLVERRKYVAFKTAKVMRECFVDPILEEGYELDILVGNHDIPLRYVVTQNAQRELLPATDKIRIYDRPGYCKLDNLNVLMLPWICKENEKESMELIERGGEVCFGHLQLLGFDQYRGQPATEGIEAERFAKFEAVFSGHFHHRSARENIFYLGAPYETSWNDFDDRRGFYIMNTETFKLDYFQNKTKVHAKAYYEDGVEGNPEYFEQFRDKIVKLIIKSKKDPIAYDLWVEALNEAKPISVTPVDDHLKKDAPTDLETAGGEINDTMSLLMGCVDEYGTTCDRDALRKLLTNLYERASEIQA